jgi:hypothetical protein
MTVIGAFNIAAGGEVLPMVATTGMTAALAADSYFAVRYTDDSDQIEFNPLERFGRESWTA